MSDKPEDPSPQRAPLPKPVRDGLPAIAGDSGSPNDEPGDTQRRRRGRGRRGRKRGGKGEPASGKGDRVRPTPVRESLGSSDGSAPAPQIRTFVGADQEWVAKTSGRALAAPNAVGGAPLLHLTFHRPEGEAVPVREILVVGTKLEDFGDDELVDLLARSRAYREPEKRARAGTKGRKRGL